MACASVRRPALEELNAPYPERPLKEALAPVNSRLPPPLRIMRRTGFASEQEAAEADGPPALFEVARLHVDDAAGRVVAGVVDRELDAIAGLIEQRHDVGFVRRIGNDGHRLSAGGLDAGDDRLQRGLRASGYINLQSLGRKTSAQLRAETAVRADTDDDRLAHIPFLLGEWSLGGVDVLQ